MKTYPKITVSQFANKCVASCQKLIAQITRVKDSIQTEFRQTVKANDHLLHLALNEAEALAWQTPYPALLFPALALEKAEAVAAWNVRQRSIRFTSPPLRRLQAPLL